MTDEQPGTTEPNPTVPTEPAFDPPAPPTEPTPAAAAGVPAPKPRRGVTVPLWAFVAVGGALLFLLGGIVGYAVGEDDHDERRSVAVNLPDRTQFPSIPGFGDGDSGPFGNGDRNGGGNDRDGSDGTAPSAPQTDGAFLGVAARTSSDPKGAELVRVVPGSPAADADLETGDVVTKVDDQTITNAATLTSEIQSQDAGDDVEITYVRDGDTTTVTVTLGDRTATSTQ